MSSKSEEKAPLWTAEDRRAAWGCLSAVLVAVIGGLFTLIANDKLPVFTPGPTATPGPSPTATGSPTATPRPTPDPNTAFSMVGLPSDTECPYDERAGWLEYRDVWHGSWQGYYLQHTQAYFVVYDPYQDSPDGTPGLEILFSREVERNAWLELGDAPFWVCQDSADRVYTMYLP